MFDKKILPTQTETEKMKPKVSTLSLMLENATMQGTNPFLDYAKFDGKVCTEYYVTIFICDALVFMV